MILGDILFSVFGMIAPLEKSAGAYLEGRLHYYGLETLNFRKDCFAEMAAPILRETDAIRAARLCMPETMRGTVDRKAIFMAVADYRAQQIVRQVAGTMMQGDEFDLLLSPDALTAILDRNRITRNA